LRDRLPPIQLPLKSENNDVRLDLQAVLDRVYDTGPYVARIDYQRDAPTPLLPADAAWADELLKNQGLRT